MVVAEEVGLVLVAVGVGVFGSGGSSSGDRGGCGSCISGGCSGRGIGWCLS